MHYQRMPIEIESPENLGYDAIKCNLAESSVSDLRLGDLDIDLSNLVIAYGDHTGKPALREWISQPHRGIGPGQVLLTAGAAAALFIIHTSLLQKGDHLVVIRPNYATNLETPRAIGCDISYIDLEFKEDFHLDIELVKATIRPDTKLISVTTPHNPTGTMLSKDQLQSLCELAGETNCLLLVDETYRDISFDSPPPLAATMSANIISVSSVSKAYGIPGVRLGWIICQDDNLQQLFLAAKEQIQICNSVIDEEITYQFLIQKEKYFPAILKRVQTNFKVLDNWMNRHSKLEWIRPSGGVVCFPRFRQGVEIDTEKFYSLLLNNYQTYVGPGHWFEQSKRSFRLGFGWEKEAQFAEGLQNIDLAIAQSLI